MADGTDNGFWRLEHDDLAALLARRDLTGEELRVCLALAGTNGRRQGNPSAVQARVDLVPRLADRDVAGSIVLRFRPECTRFEEGGNF